MSIDCDLYYSLDLRRLTASENKVFCLRLSDVLIIIIIKELVQQLVISFRLPEGCL